MKHTISEQIKAIQEALEIIEHYGISISPNLESRLNDAGSTLAAINMNPDREKRIKELEIALHDMTTKIDSAILGHWRGYYIGKIGEQSEKMKSLLK